MVWQFETEADQKQIVVYWVYSQCIIWYCPVLSGEEEHEAAGLEVTKSDSQQGEEMAKDDFCGHLLDSPEKKENTLNGRVVQRPEGRQFESWLSHGSIGVWVCGFVNGNGN